MRSLFGAVFLLSCLSVSWAFAQTPPEDENLMPMQFVKIKPGKFMMGSPDGKNGTPAEKDRSDNEVQHEVTLTHGFEMQITHVTQAQWFKVMGTNPSQFSQPQNCPGAKIPEAAKKANIPMCPNHPMENVSWNDIAGPNGFIEKLNAMKKDKYVYRLPTEAEWEYAARAGATTAFAYGDGYDLLPQYAVYRDNNPGSDGTGNSNNAQPADVASLQPNPWGLYDMNGNLWHWVQDWYGDYPRGPAVNPTGPATGSFRVIRGGAWNDGPQYLRSAFRNYDYPSNRYNGLGFRLVRTPKVTP